MTNIINANWLKENLDKPNLVVVDCRFDLKDKEYGEKCYKKEHIKNAVRIDLETELSSPVKEHGGRHPIPTIEELKNTFEEKGISNDSIVVAYDDGDIAGPSRLWFILKYLGHGNVYVLDGGIEEFKKKGGETTSENHNINRGKFEPKVNENLRVNMDYVKERLNNDKIAIIDSRENIRYIGEFEPVDKKAGHIPGALNYFWMDILNKEEDKISLKNTEKLKEHFKKLKEYEEVIIYCGSGVTACPNSLALTEIGIKHKVYTGSFSDWISYNDNKVETN